MKKIAVVFGLLMALGILGACSTTEKATETKSETVEKKEEAIVETVHDDETTEDIETKENKEVKEKAVEEAEEMKVVESKEFTFGLYGQEETITIPYEPKKIVVIGYGILDIVDALGAKDKVIGVPDPKNPMFPYYLEGYEEVTSVGSLFADDLETIAGLQPDLILGGLRAGGAYEDLSQIAPTVIFGIPGMGTEFEGHVYKNIEDIGYLLDKEEEATVAIEKLKASSTVIKEEVSTMKEPSALFLIMTGRAMNLYTDNKESRFGFVYNEFGFAPLATVEEVAEEDVAVNGEASRHGNSVSFEFVSAKNPNYILVIDRGLATGEDIEAASDVLNNPLIHATNAAKNDNIYYVDVTAWYLATGGIQATELMYEDVKAIVSKKSTNE